MSEPDDPTPEDAAADRSERVTPLRRERLKGFARKLFRELDEEIREEDEGAQSDAGPAGRRDERERRAALDLLASVLETGDKAKTEAVRMVAREFRSYLEALDLHKDLHHLLTNYSLEVKASVHLKPLGEAMGDGDTAEPGLQASLKPMDPGND